jgi:pyrroline-5-carboxylate reductase
MSNKTIGFIGGGRITRIFLEGWKRKLPRCIAPACPPCTRKSNHENTH